MGNQVQQKRRNPANCLGCMGAENEGFDPNELQLGLDNDQPRGRITQQSTAYLSENERNFFKAAAGRNLSLIRFYLTNGININILDEDRTSPLHIACRYGSLQVVEELINHGANLDITDMAGWTPLHLAAYYQRPQVCSLLINSGANTKIRNRDGNLSQDLVRDKMTAEIFKGEVLLHFEDKQQKVRDTVNQQLEEYYMNLKNKKKNTNHEINSELPPKQSKCVSPQLTPSKVAKSSEKENLKRQDSHMSRSNLSEAEFEPSANQINNDVVSSKFQKCPLSPTSSVPRFNEETIALQSLVLWENQSKECVIYDGQFPFLKKNTTTEELAIEFFNYNSYLGLSFLLLTRQVKSQPSSVVQWIYENFQIVDQRQVTNLLTSNCLHEQPQMLRAYVDKAVNKPDLIEGLRNYFKYLQVPNDPYVLDILVKEFSARHYQMHSQKRTANFPFKSEEALHMFCFALVIFDTELYKLEKTEAIKNFITNIQTINNGTNFTQNYISTIIDQMQSNSIVKLVEPPVPDSLQSRLNNSARPIHVVSLNKSKPRSYRLYQIKGVCILLSEHVIRIFAEATSCIARSKSELHIMGAENQQLLYAVSKDEITFVFKKKNKKYRLADALNL